MNSDRDQTMAGDNPWLTAATPPPLGHTLNAYRSNPALRTD